ncbi:glycosyl hydrolase family 2 [Chitinophaga polysaccharea]|uniref:Glycosyl hydrolase family 2 n=1 Tax=Chitinophaga polysaccharea TaxID=1293035 RepID=A0A561PCJ2_9BACT|nr:sugar-binding domain-containing protein [Chitinophaga polysaccharea]TWF35776.1 glycosyl hydrolase family 2 [Chitinophaga polysaccharea]
MNTPFKLSTLFILITANCFAQNNPAPSTTNNSSYKIQTVHIQSRWAENVDTTNALNEYPRPQLQRDSWQNLNGLWEYAITDSTAAIPNSFQGKILVPYPIESVLSGVKKALMPDQRLWYRKIIQRPALLQNDHIILNFGAVDWQTTVFINKKQVGQHTGGYQNFSFDVTNFLQPGNNEIIVKVYDPTDQGPNPHGKQVLYPETIYYTASSGIWQTVWLEKVESTHISSLKTTPDIDKGTLAIVIDIAGHPENNSSLDIIVSTNGKVINTLQIPASQQQVNSTIYIPNVQLWSPDSPFLYDLSIRLKKGKKITDEVKSYFGMRKIDIQKDQKGADRIFLNNKYMFNLGTLDQGFWPEGLYTAPTDEALSFDIKAIKSLGFNTIRKHIKIEPERWYYHADKIGILVWQDFVNPPQDLPPGSRVIFEKEVQETMEQLHNHPSITTWVLFNERWGAYDQERLTKWIKKNDPSRLVNGHSGELLYVNDELRAPADDPWISSDLTDVHSYPEPRNAPPQRNKARVVGEFGGIGVSVPGHEWDDMRGWGYVQVTPAELKAQYIKMTEQLKQLEKEGLTASIYTQPFDVEGEENGLLTYDRKIIKIPVDEIRSLNKELVPLTDGFTLDPNFIIAANIDTGDNDNRYQELLVEYKNTLHNDSTFLRRLTLMAIRKKDQENATLVGNSYIDILKQPFSKENLDFIIAITRTSKDIGFNFCLKKPEKVDSVLGEFSAMRKVKKIIYNEEIAPYYKNHPNWETIQQKVTTLFGSLGEECVLGWRMIYYGFEVKDWENYGKYYVLYFKKSMNHYPEYHINNLTWILFEHSKNIGELTFATNVMKHIIDKNIDRSAEGYDTYANLLHRTNNSNEAIQWEEKALALKKGAPDEKLFAETLQKMKAGLPTWPQNN